MTVHKDYTTYLFLGKEVNIISDVLGNDCRNTIAEVEGLFHYLGDKPDNLTTAVLIWQEINGRVLSQEEYVRVLTDNNVIQIN